MENKEETLIEQIEKAKELIKSIYGNNTKLIKENQAFLEELIYNDDDVIEEEVEVVYSNIECINSWGVKVMVPEEYKDYWNLIVHNRVGLIKKITNCKSQFFFNIKIKENFEIFNKLTDDEKLLYINI